MIRLENTLSIHARPDALLVYGDTNSTLAAALVASKQQIPVIHVESGLRSFNHHMPEELNRLITDRLSSTLFCPTPASVVQLNLEGISDGVHLSGDVMYEATLRYAEDSSDPFEEFSDSGFGIVTVHRADNTDNPGQLSGIIRGLGLLGYPLLFPVHPRTAIRLRGLTLPENIHTVEPVSYRTMLSLVRRADVVITDSGGLQKEALWLGTRCLTLRNETEWTETLGGGWNQLVGSDADRLLAADSERPAGAIPEFGFVGGQFASRHIVDILLQ